MKRVIITTVIIALGIMVSVMLYRQTSAEVAKYQSPQPPQTVECLGKGGRSIEVGRAHCTQYQLVLESMKQAPQPTIAPAFNHEVEANIPHVAKNSPFDLVLLGTSHGRIFSRNDNHQTVSKILDRRFANLSQGGDRAGLRNQQTYLRYFYVRGNSTPVVLYLLDPYVFFNAGMDRNLKLYDGEPFDLGFYEVLLQHPPTNEEILARYGNRRLLVPTQTPSKSYISQNIKTVTTPIDPLSLQKRIDSLYTTDYENQAFEESIETFIQTVKLVQANNSRLIVMVPTTLFPTQTQDSYVIDAMKQLSKTHDFEFYNNAHAIPDAGMYSDTDHLNAAGIWAFATNYMKPVLDAQVARK